MRLDKTANKNIDVVIPYHNKDNEIIEMCITGCRKNIDNLRNIYIVGTDKDQKFAGVQIVDENEVFENSLSKRYIESRWSIECPHLVGRVGWLFQQFIKMGCSYAISDLGEHYLVVDADVVFLKRLHLFHKGRMVLAKSEEFHQPYLDCYERLLGEPANRECSFVAHHMLIRKCVMLELLDKIEDRFNTRWYDAILDNLDNTTNSMFSEYETYGHYLRRHYPDQFITRKPRNVQGFKRKDLLKLVFNQADYVTLHDYKKPTKNPKTDPRIYKLFLSLVRKKLQRQKTQSEFAPPK